MINIFAPLLAYSIHASGYCGIICYSGLEAYYMVFNSFIAETISLLTLTYAIQGYQINFPECIQNIRQREKTCWMHS